MIGSEGEHTHEIPLDSDGRLLVVRRGDAVSLRRPGRWEQALTLEQAWRLSEALDAAATAAAPDS